MVERLETLRRQRADAERRLDEVRERAQRAELDEAEVRLRLETAVETVRRDLECEPEQAVAAECPELPAGTSPPARARELERELRLMGPINPLALEESRALPERHTFLEAQLDDVKPTGASCAKVIRAIDAEIVDVFAAAFADVGRQLHEAVRDAVPRRHRPAAPHRSRRPARHRHRGRGPAVGQERAQAVAAVRWRALAHRAGVPVRRVPQPAVALLPDGRGRGRARRREPAPLPRPRRRVPRRGAAADRCSHQKRTMEAADAIVRRHHAAGGSSKVVFWWLTITSCASWRNSAMRSRKRCRFTSSSAASTSSIR